jgi:hypothetical protein
MLLPSSRSKRKPKNKAVIVVSNSNLLVSGLNICVLPAGRCAPSLVSGSDSPALINCSLLSFSN